MEIDFVLKIAAVGIIVAVLHTILSKAGRDEYAMIVTLSGIIAVIMMLMPYVLSLFSSVKSVFGF